MSRAKGSGSITTTAGRLPKNNYEASTRILLYISSISTSIPISKSPLSLRVDALSIIDRLRAAGHVAYLAGGCVRDQLLGIEPKDFDVATDAPPARVRELFKNTQAVGASFGVMLVRQRGSVIEVATFRADGKYLDGRHPSEIKFATPEEDAQRRDFTINGLFFDPAENRVIDFVGGQEDLRAKTIRAIGDATLRFEEDHLRMLRAVRFAARFNFAIAEETFAAIKKNATHLARISPERIADELRIMLTSQTRVDAWRLLEETDLLPVILRHLPKRSADHSPIFPRLIVGETVSFPLALAAIVFDFRCEADARKWLSPLEIQRAVQAIRTGLKVSNDESEHFFSILNLSNLLADVEPSVAMMKRFLAGESSVDSRKFLAAMGASDETLQPRVRWLEDQFAALSQSPVAPIPFVSGDDLIAAGMTPGKLFKRVLDEVYDAQLEDRVKSKEEAMGLAREIAAR